MITFNILTIFPRIFDSYLNESILKRAQEKKLIKIKTHDIRKYTTDKHHTVDDKPYGGGAGMVIKIEPIYRAVQFLKLKVKSKNIALRATTRRVEKSRIILLSAKGKLFNQKEAERLAKYERLVLICGRYEGVDERVAKNIADEEISVGNFVLTGGELGAMIVIDAVSRLTPGVLGNPDSLIEESFSEIDKTEYPQYTRPEKFRNWPVPKVLLSGNHQEIKKWRERFMKT